MKRKLIIINPAQFGYNNATYYYSKYLRPDFNLFYIGWNHELCMINMHGVQTVYVSRQGNMMVRSWRFLRVALSQINDKNSIVFIKYFKVVSLILRLLRFKNVFVLDIRTGSVHKNPLVRRIQDVRLIFETRFFKNVTVISKSLAEKLKIKEKVQILPLGAEVISDIYKTYNTFDLLYVGTLFNRNLDITIHGFKKFYEVYKDKIPLSYTIVGDGPDKEEDDLRALVYQMGLTDVVKITGRIPHTELSPFFDKCNIGVSYVPMTDYYDCQPVTKTFEYLLSGMPVVGTRTSENQKVINATNGVLVSDSPDDFHLGLKNLFLNRHMFDSRQIRNNALEFTWENIVNQKLKTYLYKITCENPYQKIHQKINPMTIKQSKN